MNSSMESFSDWKLVQLILYFSPFEISLHLAREFKFKSVL